MSGETVLGHGPVFLMETGRQSNPSKDTHVKGMESVILFNLDKALADMIKLRILRWDGILCVGGPYIQS